MRFLERGEHIANLDNFARHIVPISEEKVLRRSGLHGIRAVYTEVVKEVEPTWARRPFYIEFSLIDHSTSWTTAVLQ